MSVVSISIPPVADYRYHLRLVLTFMLAHLRIDDNGNKGPIDFKDVVELEEVLKLTKKLVAAKPNKSFKISLTEGLVFYKCFVLMNKILVSKHDELITIELLKLLPPNHSLKDFKAFRDEMLYVNTHLIEDSEKKFKSHNELVAIKDRLAEIDLG
jgi:hypothetical protein